MAETREIRGVSGMLLIVFLLGGTLGYIMRDVRADREVKEAAASARKDVEQATSAARKDVEQATTAARKDVEQATTTALQRVQQVGAALGHGAAATAESTKVALTAPTQPKDSATQNRTRKTASAAKGK